MKMQNWGGMLLETAPNPNFITLHSRCALVGDTDGTEHDERGYISDYNKNLIGVRPLTKAIVERLRSMKGVTSVSVWPYQVNIQKSPAFCWKELRPEIIKTFAMYIPANDFCS